MDTLVELRCHGRIHGRIQSDHRFEVKCHSRACGAKSGVVVLHYFDVNSGKLLETKRFKDAESSQMFNDKKEKAV